MGQRANPQVQENLAQIRILMIANRSGQILRNYLLDDLTPRGVEGEALYSLRVVLFEPRREVAISRDNTASVVAYTATAQFQLVENTGKVVFASASNSQSTYVLTNSEFATLSSFNAARDRVLQDVSADM